MSLFNTCSNVLVNSNISLSSIKHLNFGKIIILDRLDKNLDKIFYEHLYKVCDKYDLEHLHEQKKGRSFYDEINKVLYEFNINLDDITFNVIHKFDIIDTLKFNEKFYDKCDKLLCENIKSLNSRYGCNIKNKIYISNTKIIKNVIINTILKLQNNKTIYFIIKSSKNIYKLTYMYSRDAYEECYNINLRNKYSRTVEALIDY